LGWGGGRSAREEGWPLRMREYGGGLVGGDQVRQQRQRRRDEGEGARTSAKESRLKFADGWGNIGGVLGLLVVTFFWDFDLSLFFFCS